MTGIVTFLLDERRFALPLERVERALRAVAVTPLAGAPSAIAGAIDVRGRIVPVIDLRRRLGLPPRDLDPSDHFLLAHSRTRPLALAVDAVAEVADCPDPVGPAALGAGTEHLLGIVRLADGLVLIHDLDRFLSADEELELERALRSD